MDFGSGHPATSVTVNSTTSITATSPARPSGTIDVTATSPYGTSTTNSADAFTYDAVPTVTAVRPGAGPIQGGSMVQIIGTGFVAGSTSVTFGAGHIATSITVDSPTVITATPPADTGTVDITVTTPGGTSYTSPADKFTYSSPPLVTAISRNTGPTAGGTNVTITGTSFVAGATSVAFGTRAATKLTVSASSITATSPAAAGAGTVDITITTPGGTSATKAADTFTYIPGPTVTAIEPTAGAPVAGTRITIHGSNLGGAVVVSFGSKPASSLHHVSSREITAVAPRGRAGSVDVTITTHVGTSPATPAARFTYATAPIATGKSATLVIPTGALLRGTLDPHDLAPTACQFEFGRTTKYGRRLACAQAIAPTMSAVLVSAVVSGLVPATTYHFRLLTRTLVGTGRGRDEQFTTPIVRPRKGRT